MSQSTSRSKSSVRGDRCAIRRAPRRTSPKWSVTSRHSIWSTMETCIRSSLSSPYQNRRIRSSSTSVPRSLLAIKRYHMQSMETRDSWQSIPVSTTVRQLPIAWWASTWTIGHSVKMMKTWTASLYALHHRHRARYMSSQGRNV